MLMKLNNISLPYPVLGISDDITPLLPDDSISVNFKVTRKSYLFHIHLKYDNEDIKRLVENGSAEYTCEFVCSKTMLRKCVSSKQPDFEISLQRKDVSARIIFNCYVSVKDSIQGYTNSGFNEDYDNITFDMEPGDILVAFPEIYYDADIKYDKLQAAGSFMLIRENENIENVFFDIAGDRIEIQLPPRLYELYCNPIVKGAAEVIHSSLVVNALTYALLSLETEYEDSESRLWARTIYYRLRTEEGLSVDDLSEPSRILSLVQKLLKDPYLRLFNHLIINNSNNESDDGISENI